MLRIGSASALAIVGIAASAAVAAAQPSITVCEHVGFRGRCITLRHGVNDLRDWGFSNRISSFRIGGGTWRLCTGFDLSGACDNFSRSVADLRGTRLQDAVSSLRPVRGGRGGGATTAIVVYSQPQFRGRSWVFSDDVPDLRRVGLNDEVSSLRVLGGRWQICVDIHYRGCRTIRGDVPDLRAIGLNNTISSIREGGNWGPDVDEGRGGRRDDLGTGRGGRGGSGAYGQITLYEDRGFRGRSFVVRDEIRNLTHVDFNDVASSIRVEGGRWQVCTDADFRGHCEVINGNLSRLGSILDDRISSVRRF